MTIKKKLILSTIAINAALLIIGITLLFGYGYVTEKASLANNFDKESMYLQMMLRGLNEVIINEGTPDSINTAKDGMNGFDVIHSKLKAPVNDEELQAILTGSIEPEWQKIKESINPFFNHYLDLGSDESLLRIGRIITDAEVIVQQIKTLSDKTRAIVNQNSAMSAIIQNIMIAVIIIVFLLSAILSYKIYTSITVPIYSLNMIAEGFSKGDLSVSMDESRKDEFGLLALHFNKSIAKLKQYTRELQDFAHIASHDLQEPLRKILAFGDRLQTNHSESLGDKGVNYLERMQKAAKRMQRLVESLLVYSQVIRQEKPFVKVDLMDVAHGVLSDLGVHIQYVEGHVEIGSLPTLYADPVQMQQLFQNIISNALKFNKKDEPPFINVTSTSICKNGSDSHRNESADEYYQITFQDNGIGFEEKYADRIFKVFQRLHGQNEYQGTGIGLSLCRKIVERHGGSIKAESSPNAGTKFIVSLPVESHGGEHGEQ
jgi:signal transduction histidine kinase